MSRLRVSPQREELHSTKLDVERPNDPCEQLHAQVIKSIFHRKALNKIRPLVVFRLRRVVFENVLNLESHREIGFVLVHDQCPLPSLGYQSPARGRSFVGVWLEFRTQEIQSIRVDTPFGHSKYRIALAYAEPVLPVILLPVFLAVV